MQSSFGDNNWHAVLSRFITVHSSFLCRGTEFDWSSHSHSQQQEYVTTKDFVEDFKLMIRNAKEFNRNGSAVYVVRHRAFPL